MVVVEPVVNAEKLGEILSEGSESESLEFKGSCDLNDREDWVDFVAEAGAMQSQPDGGYIVVGLDDTGNVTNGLPDSQVRLYDQARVHDKLAAYIPEPFTVMSQVHKVTDNQGAEQNMALVYIAPSEDCFTIFKTDGDYTKSNGKPAKRFRKGDVFARHGTKSEPWNQADIRRLRECLKAQERAKWERDSLRPLIDELRQGEDAQTLARRGPAQALDWRLDSATFTAMVVEQLRADDDIPLTLFLRRLPRDASELLARESAVEDLGVLLDRAACLISVLLSVERTEIADRSIKALLDIYRLGFDEQGFRRSDLGQAVSAAHLWLMIIERVEAIGALAIRLEQWEILRPLILQTSDDRDMQRYASWIRHGLTAAANAGLFQRKEGDRTVYDSLIALARTHVDRLDCLRPDAGASDERIVSSLCQFDFLAVLAQMNVRASWYPSFARFYSARVEPMTLRLIQDQPPRQDIFPRSDRELAEALKEINEVSAREAFAYAGWMGFEDERVVQFINENLSDDDRPY